MYKHFANEKEITELREKFVAGGMGYGTAKTILFEKINTILSEPRAEYERLMNNPDEIEKVLQDGATRAGKVADKTISRTKKAMFG